MSGHTDTWHEFNDAQRQYYDALEQQVRAQERFVPPGERRTEHAPVQLPDPLTAKVIQGLSTLDRIVHDARQRYAEAINAVHAEV
ncbi:MAG: hypothetical protein HQ475_14725 [SAR202 cluster bacterium]|nr:hypothetical protein [SAR202 cluster bacterium]